jgi:hypothetical protein
VNEGSTPEKGHNEAFSHLLAVVQQLEWSGVNNDGEASCPTCRASEYDGVHLETCQLRSALDEVTGSEHWPWCRCDACECPNQVDPSLNGTLCDNCARGMHHDDRGI